MHRGDPRTQKKSHSHTVQPIAAIMCAADLLVVSKTCRWSYLDPSPLTFLSEMGTSVTHARQKLFTKIKVPMTISSGLTGPNGTDIQTDRRTSLRNTAKPRGGTHNKYVWFIGSLLPSRRLPWYSSEWMQRQSQKSSGKPCQWRSCSRTWWYWPFQTSLCKTHKL